jgi:hypothetical protein
MPSADEGAARVELIPAALRLLWMSVAFGVLTGGVSVMAGLGDHSLGVAGVGLSVLADVTGSAVGAAVAVTPQVRGSFPGAVLRER